MFTKTSRRSAIKSIAGAAIGLSFPMSAYAQGSIFKAFAPAPSMTAEEREHNSRQAIASIGGTDPIISLDTEYNLQRVADYYERLQSLGGWEQVPTSIYQLELGAKRAPVKDLRNYLVSTGDLPVGSDNSDSFDAILDAGVRGFQARHGLKINGKIDEHTYWAMAVPTSTRLEQIRLNLQRVRGMEGQFNSRYVNVNIPAATIEAVEGGKVAQRHAAVVGRIDRQTPILKSRVHQINFNPYWHVPKSIIERDIIKLMNEDPNYLTNYRIRIFDGRGQEIPPSQINWQSNEAVNYMLRQDPGGENSMAHAKINFYNKHDVYLHDTPQRDLFGENARFHSSGCVRVDHVDELIAWLLREDGYDIIGVNGYFASGERKDVAVKNPVPILMTYFTAWANSSGVVSFRDDIYEFDKAGRTDFPEIGNA